MKKLERYELEQGQSYGAGGARMDTYQYGDYVLLEDVQAAIGIPADTYNDNMHALLVRMSEFAKSWTAEHYMLPGSHEQSFGPQCCCGGEWNIEDRFCSRLLIANPHLGNQL